MPTNAVELQGINKQFPARRGEVPVMAVEDVNLNIEDGEFFSMLGPSGCGKTTTLRMIAGFEEPTSGKILLEGKDVVGIPPFHRPVNTVFQDYALFPHLTVQQNVAFGLEMEGKPRKLIAERVKQVLDMVQLPNMERRTPRQLSGGQQQRVALARALVKEPRVLLLDEPLGALDLKLRKQMQLELKQMQRKLGITFVFVTHDQEEALTMSDRIAVMDKGRILQVGAPEEIYDRPVNRFVADFIGETNFLEGCIAEAGTAGTMGTVLVDNRWPVQGHLSGTTSVNVNDTVALAIRPEKVELRAVADGAAPASEPNMLPGRIEEKIFIGTDTRYIVRLDHGPTVVSRIQNDMNHDQLPIGAVVSAYCSPKYALILTH